MGCKENKSGKVLYLIETSIKNGNADIKSFKKNLLTNLKRIEKIEKLIYRCKIILEKKNIYFIRHAQSEHNVLEHKYAHEGFQALDKWNIRDPKLTEKGIEETKDTIKKLKQLNVHFDSVFVSPLRRAVQTYCLIEKELNDDAKIIITDFIREVLSYKLDKNKGTKLSQLKEEYKNTKLNFEFMTKEYWWFDLGQDIEGKSEGYERFLIRLYIFILWLIFRPDNNILIISHSHVFIEIQESMGIYNADIVKLNNEDLLNRVTSLLKS